MVQNTCYRFGFLTSAWAVLGRPGAWYDSMASYKTMPNSNNVVAEVSKQSLHDELEASMNRSSHLRRAFASNFGLLFDKAWHIWCCFMCLDVHVPTRRRNASWRQSVEGSRHVTHLVRDFVGCFS